MAKIYFINAQGKKVSVEVSEEIAKQYRESLREEWRNDAYDKYYAKSLEGIIEVGRDFEDEKTDTEVEQKSLSDKKSVDCRTLGTRHQRQDERPSHAARFARRRKRNPTRLYQERRYGGNAQATQRNALADMHSYKKQHIEGLLAHLKMSEKMSACIYNILLAIATDEPVTKMQVEIGYMDDVPKRFIEFLSELLAAVFDDDDGDSEDIPGVLN